MTEVKAIPELSLDTQTVERILLSVEVGSVVTYAILSESIGRNVQEDARHIMESARRRVLRSHQMVFEPVIDVGLKRLDDVGIVSLGPSVVGRIHNLAKRGSQKLSSVQDFDALPNELKIELSTRRAQLGVMRHMSTEKVTKKLSGAISEPTKAMPLRQSLEAMKSAI